MQPRQPLPPGLRGRVFTVGVGRRHGLGDGRLRGRDLRTPFRGVRVDGDAETLLVRCRSLSAVMAPHQVFSHLTAAELWGMPLPRTGGDLHVTALGRRGKMRRPGVVGWERADATIEPQLVRGLPVTAPADTWCQLSTLLSREWLVAVGDFLVSGARLDRGRAMPLCAVSQLAESAAAHGARRGARPLAWALTRLRAPVDSPRESLLRLALVAGGLPEPEVQLPVQTSRGVLHGDLGYRRARLIIEYQGDEHRASRTRWLRDLTRVQLLEDAGYRVILVGADDLRDGARALVARIRRILSAHM